jgi:hypothetical protein
MTSFVFCVLDMSVRVDAVLVCHVIDNVVAAADASLTLKTLLRQLRNCVRLTTSSMRHSAGV